MAFQSSVAALVSIENGAIADKATALHNQLHALIDATQRTQRPLKAGDHAMDFCLTNRNEKKISLAKSLIKGPVLLLISRGPWCAGVREQLLDLAEIYPQIAARCVSLIAIAPSWEIPRDVDANMSRRLASLPFALLTDEDYKIAGAYGLTFIADAQLRFQYRALGYCNNHFAEPEPILVPATYLISRAGEIIFSMIDSDPANFLRPDTLLRMLENMSRRPDV